MFGSFKHRLVDFFFQAEDGILDKLVTGVQTCALPILPLPCSERASVTVPSAASAASVSVQLARRANPCAGAALSVACGPNQGKQTGTPPRIGLSGRSEERRGGKEGRYGGWL